MRISRSEILRLDEYEAQRDAIRARVMDAKRRRRIQLGPLTFLFENVDTVKYQIQEMLRAERLYRDAEVQHEIDTYGELLGGDGELGCTMLIELTDPNDREEKLRAWRDLPRHVYVTLGDGRRVPARYDHRQVGDDRLSSVQYLKFHVDRDAPVSIGSDLHGLELESRLTDEQRAALADDLRLPTAPARAS